MKSVWAFGMYIHFWRLVPSPTPNHPPDPSAMRDWISWYPVFFASAQGWRNDRKRARRYPSPMIRANPIAPPTIPAAAR